MKSQIMALKLDSNTPHFHNKRKPKHSRLTKEKKEKDFPML